MNADNILNQALSEMEARGKQSKDGSKERNMAATVAAFNAITGRDLNETEGWMFMVMLKAVRTVQRVGNMDSYVDGAAYFALAGESSVIDPVAESATEIKRIAVPGFEGLAFSWAKYLTVASRDVWEIYEKRPVYLSHLKRWSVKSGRFSLVINNDENENTLHSEAHQIFEI